MICVVGGLVEVLSRARVCARRRGGMALFDMLKGGLSRQPVVFFGIFLFAQENVTRNNTEGSIAWHVQSPPGFKFTLAGAAAALAAPAALA